MRGSSPGRAESGKPLVSIITVTFNRRETLETTLQSVIEQTYDPIEHIVIDGGSNDGTLALLRRYDDRLTYWMSEPDQGISDAFNKGIAAATGEVIGILNSDDWYTPDCVEEVMHNFNNTDIVHGKLQYWDQNNTKHYLFTASHDLLPLEMTINHPTVFIRKEIYEKYGLFRIEYKYAMDYELLLRYYLSGVRFFYLDKVLANMSLSGVSDENWFLGYKECMEAKIEMTNRKIAPMLYCVKQVLRTSLSRSFDRIGLSHFKALYRKRFSKVKKQTNSTLIL